jgi:hypothetical protein
MVKKKSQRLIVHSQPILLSSSTIVVSTHTIGHQHDDIITIIHRGATGTASLEAAVSWLCYCCCYSQRQSSWTPAVFDDSNK